MIVKKIYDIILALMQSTFSVLGVVLYLESTKRIGVNGRDFSDTYLVLLIILFIMEVIFLLIIKKDR